MRLFGSFLFLGLAVLCCAGPRTNMSSTTSAAPLPKATAVAEVPAGDDPYLWLEDVGGDKRWPG